MNLNNTTSFLCLCLCLLPLTTQPSLYQFICISLCTYLVLYASLSLCLSLSFQVSLSFSLSFSSCLFLFLCAFINFSLPSSRGHKFPLSFSLSIYLPFSFSLSLSFSVYLPLSLSLSHLLSLTLSLVISLCLSHSVFPFCPPSSSPSSSYYLSLKRATSGWCGLIFSASLRSKFPSDNLNVYYYYIITMKGSQRISILLHPRLNVRTVPCVFKF